MQPPPDRRAVLSGLLSAVVILWARAPRAATQATTLTLTPSTQAPRRVRAGERLRLRCAGAEGFALEGLLQDTLPAVAGELALFAPSPMSSLGQLRCTPLRQGRPWGEAVEIVVVSMAPRFGG
ncbi:hypothetical protein KKF91_21080 [Myxococcota bacterium]|nr:hypothetical protein [Myxococcota bacterium]MBU1433038.1 hypothetical protein [Myxococcota bacterium]MBU1899927.1 hypothetical protein [Myxococcota bacterium]